MGMRLFQPFLHLDQCMIDIGQSFSDRVDLSKGLVYAFRKRH